MVVPPNTSYPLAVRRRLAVLIARMALASSLLSLLLAVIAPTGMDYPAGLMLLVLGPPMAVEAFVGLAPMQRLSSTHQEWALRLLTLSAMWSVYGSTLIRTNDNGAGFGFAGFALLVSAVSLRARDHAAVVAISSVVGLAMVFTLLPNPMVGLFILLPGLLVGVVAGYGTRLHNAALTHSEGLRITSVEATDALRAIAEAARRAIGADREALLSSVVEATRLLGAEAAAVYTLDDDGMIRFAAHRGLLGNVDMQPIGPGEGLLGEVLRQDATISVGDYMQYTAAMPAFKQGGLRVGAATPIRRPDGSILGLLAMGRVTILEPFPAASIDALEVLAEQAGRALQASLEVDADRRTLRSLEVLTERQRDFVATASHELRTPVTVIDGIADTLARHGDALTPEQHAHFLSRLVSNSTMLRSIVESLLDTTSLQEGLTAGHEIVDLSALATEALERLGSVLAEHHILARIAPGLLVRGDEGLLVRVIDNLLINVERHTPAETVVVVSVQLEGGRVVLRVTDDGPGIPADVLPRITERFVRAGDHHTRTSRGMGIGLALAEQVLRLHGSRLDVTSREGEGAEFSFRLAPALDADAAMHADRPAGVS